MFTFLKNMKPKISRNTEAYFWPKRHEIVEPSRFDTIEKAVRKETHKNLYNTKYNEMMRAHSKTSMKKIDYKDKPLEINPFHIKQ
jgi:hypothetical protein